MKEVNSEEHMRHISIVRCMISVGLNHIVAVKTDGTVIAAGKNNKGQCNVNTWENIIAVGASMNYTIGLTSKGTVVMAGELPGKNIRIPRISQATAFATSWLHTIYLRNDGTVLSDLESDGKPGPTAISDWKNVVKIATARDHSVGLCKNGTVLATPIDMHSAERYYGQCDVGDWTDIVDIAAGDQHTVGLRSDGTVISTEYLGPESRYKGQCNVNNWKNIVAVFAWGCQTMGITSDGTVLLSSAEYDVMKVKDISNVLAVWGNVMFDVSSAYITLTPDGYVKLVGDTSYLPYKDVNWRLFQNIDTLDAEIEKDWGARQSFLEATRPARREALRSEHFKLTQQLSTLKGLFSGGKRKMIEERLVEIELELKQL